MKKTTWTNKGLVFMLALLVPGLATGQQASYYVLDGFGGVHAGGDAPAITPPPPYFGFDIARDLTYVPVGKRIGPVDVVGDGVLVLDAFGGVHAGGALPRSMTTPTTPYFGFDAARAIVARDVPPRAAGSEVSNAVELLSPAWTPIATATIRAPDDGFLMVSASANVECYPGPGPSNVQDALVGIALDGIQVSSTPHLLRFPCGSGPNSWTNFALVHMFPVSAGAHLLHLVAARSGGNGRAFFHSRTIQVLFVDQNGMGGS